MVEEPGYRESYPYVDSLRAKYPGRWVVLGSYSADSRQELSGGEVLVTAEDPRALSGRPGAGQPIVIIPPTVYRDQYVTFFRGDPPCRAAAFDEVTKEVSDRALRSYLAAVAVSAIPYFDVQHRPSFAYWVVNRFLRGLAHVDGFDRCLLLLGAQNENVVKGRIQELTRLYGLRHYGHEPASIGRWVEVPGVGRTDIDVLTRAGTWIESKRTDEPLALKEPLREKLKKMAAARDQKMVVDCGSEQVTISDLVLVNNSAFTSPVKDYAASLGIRVEERAVFAWTLLPELEAD